MTQRFVATFTRNWWAIALRGVLGIVLGIVAIVLPAVTIASLVLLLGAYFLLDGIFALISGFRAVRHDERWWPFFLEGLLDLLAAAIAFLFPVATILALVALVAAWSILTGAVMLYGALRGYRGHGSPFYLPLLAVEGRAGPLAASGRIQSLVGVSALLPALIRTILGMPRMPLLGRGPTGSIANLAR